MTDRQHPTQKKSLEAPPRVLAYAIGFNYRRRLADMLGWALIAFSLGTVAYQFSIFTADGRGDSYLLLRILGASLGSLSAVVIFRKHRPYGHGFMGFVGLLISTIVFLGVVTAAVMYLLSDPPIDVRAVTKCSSRMHATAAELREYADMHDGRFPELIGSVLEMEDIGPDPLHCPAVPESRQSEYLYFGKGLRPDGNRRCILLTEQLQNHDRTGINVAYADGTVEFIRGHEASRVLAALWAGKNPPGP